MIATDKSSLTAAFKMMRRYGIFARQNFLCCQTCGRLGVAEAVEEKRKKNDDVPLGYCFYHAQDAATLRNEGRVMLAYGAIDAKGDSTAVGSIIAMCLRKCGVAYKWDGSRYTRIEAFVRKEVM